MSVPKQRVWMFYNHLDRECEWCGSLSAAEDLAQFILDEFPEHAPIEIHELLEVDRHQYTGDTE